MRSLAVGAALAVAAVAAHGQLAEAVYQENGHFSSLRGGEDDLGATPTELSAITADGSCLGTINKWRKEVIKGLQDYTEIKDVNAISQRGGNHFSKTDLATFFKDKTCDTLKAGKFAHISEQTSVTKAATDVYVFSASKPAASRSDMTCDAALAEWKKGFSAFDGQTPPGYTDNEKVYANPNAAAIVALLQKSEQKIFCGTPTECENDTILCYIKPSPITAGKAPVDAAIWHAVQEHFETKPTLKVHEKDHGLCLKAVNDVRNAEGLKLPAFTALDDATPKRARAKRETGSDKYKSYEKALYDLTCKDIDNGTINPAAADGYTIIYATKKGDEAPTGAEAVAHWESGFEKLGYNQPPAFKIKNEEETEDQEGSLGKAGESAAESASQIYDDSSVAGYVSLMTADTREMECFDATGCTNSALICILKEETLKNGEKPITDETWKKIQKIKGFTKPEFEARDENENCIEEINAVRTEEALGLKPFTAVSTTKANTEQVSSELLNTVTCENLKAGKVRPVLPSKTRTDTGSSLLYYSGSESTCANAVSEWRKGFEKFSGVELPPAYTENEEIYEDGKATNFISLMSDGEKTVAKCYNATGCDESAIVCELTPAVFKLNQRPISEATWKKITDAEANGAAATFSSIVVLTSAALAVAGVALQL